MDVLADAAIHSKSVLRSSPNLTIKPPHGVEQVSRKADVQINTVNTTTAAPPTVTNRMPGAPQKAAIQESSNVSLLSQKEQPETVNPATNFVEAQVLGSYVQVKLLSKLDGRQTVKVQLSDGTICEIIASRVRPCSGKPNDLVSRVSHSFNAVATQVASTSKSTAGTTRIQHPQSVAGNKSIKSAKISGSPGLRGFVPAIAPTRNISHSGNSSVAPVLSGTSGMTLSTARSPGVASTQRMPTQPQNSPIPFYKKATKTETSVQLHTGDDLNSSARASVPPLVNLHESTTEKIPATVHTSGVPRDNETPFRQQSESPAPKLVQTRGKLDRQRLCTWLSKPRISQLCRAITEHLVGKASLRKASAKHKVSECRG